MVLCCVLCVEVCVGAALFTCVLLSACAMGWEGLWSEVGGQLSTLLHHLLSRFALHCVVDVSVCVRVV